jgi:hypothetical protein
MAAEVLREVDDLIEKAKAVPPTQVRIDRIRSISRSISSERPWHSCRVRATTVPAMRLIAVDAN